MRRISWVLLAVVLCLTTILAGCGKKDADSVVKDLGKVADKLEGDKGTYQGAGVMTIHTGATPQEYQVEVWYQSPSYYRISLTNGQKNITQIVLRNDEGVFVLTPSLNKSFRFKSDWPDNQGQVYLYQTLLSSIIGDKNRQFAEDKESYVFDVAANYHSHALVRQKIWLAKDNYSPRQVQVSDSQANVVVDVKFNTFTFDTNLTKESFDTQRNLNAMSESQGTLAEVDENGLPVEPSGEEIAEGTEGILDPVAEKDMGSFGIIEPGYTPAGVAHQETMEIPDSKDHAVILKYNGVYQYTIMESRPLDRAVSLVPGEAIYIDFTTVGLLTGDQQKTLTWTTDGVEYRITSTNLPVEEMVNIAASMQDQSGK
ncbi:MULTISPECIES: LolA family protein [Paenibacillus]|uniref:DUF4367 domain-containing protein n=1 Tax=Paenibacillus campinasensis TaxID=66347 RepID=A0A268EX84_9BACL|nr:outer membrane lipoprotein carrier protein LolA [Paenibacillus campinasensis]PAD77741.1 DUF4367 domain-containing protein [Paenibacillus campinasensis]